MPNLGEKRFKAETSEGVKRNLTVQVCDVNKGLLSVHKVVKHSHKVVFDDDGSYLEDKKTGEKIWMEEHGGMYAIRLWVKRGEGF